MFWKVFWSRDGSSTYRVLHFNAYSGLLSRWLAATLATFGVAIDNNPKNKTARAGPIDAPLCRWGSRQRFANHSVPRPQPLTYFLRDMCVGLFVRQRRQGTTRISIVISCWRAKGVSDPKEPVSKFTFSSALPNSQSECIFWHWFHCAWNY